MSGDEPTLSGHHQTSSAPRLGGRAEVLHYVEMLDHPDEAIRERAAFALAARGDHRAADVLLAVLTDPYAGVSLRGRAGYALAKLGDKRAIAPLMEALRGEEEFQRISAIRALRLLADPQAVPLLLELALSERFHVRLEAARALGVSGREEDVVPPLITAFHAAPTDPRSRAMGLRAHIACVLAEVAFPSAVAFLIEQLQTGDRARRREAAYAFRTAPHPGATVALIAALDDEYELVRARAAEALGQLGDEAAIEPLLDRLSDGSHFVQSAVVNALGMLGTERATKPLIGLLRGTENVVRAGAIVEALAQTGSPHGRAAVARVLRRLAREHPTELHEVLDAGERDHFDSDVKRVLSVCVKALFTLDEVYAQAVVESIRLTPG